MGTSLRAVAVLVASTVLVVAAGRAQAVASTVVKVTAGKPTEYAFTLSKAKVPAGRVTFAVTNRGSRSHSFKVCAVAVTGAAVSSCSGKATTVLAPGRSGSLTVSLATPGRYAYLSGVPGQAARGMRGVIVVLSPSKPPAPSPPVTVTAPAPTPPPPSPSPTPLPTGAAGAGETVFAASCSSCHAVSEVRGKVGADLNLTHPGSFPNGTLTPAQLADLIAFVNR